MSEFPDFRASAKSWVTASGRASTMAAITPNGLVILSNRRPSSSSERSRTLPTGSSRAATALRPTAICCSLPGVKAMRSRKDGEIDCACLMSSRFMASRTPKDCSRAHAIRSRASSFVAESSTASRREAALAAIASCTREDITGPPWERSKCRSGVP